MTARQELEQVLQRVYERDAQGERHHQSGELAQDLGLELRVVVRALDRLGEQGHVRFISRVAPEHWVLAITELGRQTVEDKVENGAVHWKQDVHGQAFNQVGHHNTINYYGLEAPGVPAGSGSPIATPVVRFSVHQVGRWHNGIFLANLNPYTILLESLRFEGQVIDLRGFEWAESPRVQESLPHTARTYLASVQHPVARISQVHILPHGKWTFAVRFVTTARPEVFEAQVRYVARSGADHEAPPDVQLLTQQLIKL